MKRSSSLCFLVIAFGITIPTSSIWVAKREPVECVQHGQVGVSNRIPGPCQWTVVTGSGRSGTSLLMALFTWVGLPTGYTNSTVDEPLGEPWHAGLESCSYAKDLLKMMQTNATFVCKSPFLALPNELSQWVDHPAVNQVIVPMRDLDEVAKSRAENGNEKIGGFWNNATNAVEQRLADSKLVSDLIITLTEKEIPTILLSFPKFAKNADYAYTKLKPVLDCYGVSSSQFVQAHAKLVDGGLIHSVELEDEYEGDFIEAELGTIRKALEYAGIANYVPKATRPFW